MSYNFKRNVNVLWLSVPVFSCKLVNKWKPVMQETPHKSLDKSFFFGILTAWKWNRIYVQEMGEVDDNGWGVGIVQQSGPSYCTPSS